MTCRKNTLLRSYLSPVVSLSAGLLFAFTVLQVPASRQLWLADIANFFRLHIFLAALILCAASLFAGRGLTIFAACLAVGLNAFLAVHKIDSPTMHASADPLRLPSCAGARIRVVSANLLNENVSTDVFIRFVQKTKPEIVLTQETTELWNSAIDGLNDYQFHSDDRVWFRNDMKLISRFPIVSEKTIWGGPEYRGLKRHPVRFELNTPVPTEKLVVYLIHPETPRSPERWRQRNMYLRLLSEKIASEPKRARIIVAGDWNTPSWSPFFLDFLQSTGLKSMDSGWLPQPTRFFRKLGSLVSLGTPIDHVAISKELANCGFRTGPKFGSNHLPIVADIGF